MTMPKRSGTLDGRLEGNILSKHNPGRLERKILYWAKGQY